MFLISSWAQTVTAELVSHFPPKEHECEEVSLVLGGHPLALLYEASEEQAVAISQLFHDHCPGLSKEYRELCDSIQSDGISHNHLRHRAIENITHKKYEVVKAKWELKILDTLAQIARKKIEDPLQNIPHLIHAMSAHGFIESHEKIAYNIWKNEDYLEEKSRIYHLNRPELEGGEISYINGIMKSFDEALNDAQLFSDNLCKQHNIHGIYNVTHGAVNDIFIGVYGQKGFILQPVQYLLEQWNLFFQREASFEKYYLQICMSQGVIMTKLALEQLPEAYRKRILVIAIAPAGFIPPKEGCQVRHFVKMNDIVPVSLATDRNRLDGEDPEIIKVPPDSGIDPHDPHGQGYVDAIKPFVTNYIATNRIL